MPVSTRPPLDALMDRQIGHLLRRAYVVARKNSAAALATLGAVSPIQASAIAALAGGGLTQAELGRRIGMEPANTHALVKRLDGLGLTRFSAAVARSRRSANIAAGAG